MVAAGVGCARLRVGVWMLRYHQRIQLADQRDPGPRAGASLHTAFQAGESKTALVRYLQLVELLGHQRRSPVFPESGLGMGKRLLSDADDLFLSLVDGLAGPSLQLFNCQHI